MAVTTQQIGPYNFGYGAGGGWGNWDDRHTADNDTIVLYRFNDASGGAVDSSGNGYNLSESESGANLSYQQSGQFDYSIKGNDGDFLVNTSAGMRTAINNAQNALFTMELWIKLTDTANDQFVLSYNGGGPSDGVRFATTNTGAIRFYRYANSAGKEQQTASKYSTLVWHHAAGTINKAADELKVYYDGVQEGATISGLGAFSNSSGDLTVFAWNNGTYDSDAYVCDVAISKKIRY